MGIISVGLMMGLGAMILMKLNKFELGIALIAIMIALDGLIIFGSIDYFPKKEIALGVVLGTLIKTIIFLNKSDYGKTSSIRSHGETKS